MDVREGDKDDTDDESSSVATIRISNVNMSLFARCCRQLVSGTSHLYFTLFSISEIGN